MLQNRGDLHARELLEGRKQQHFALLGGQLLHARQHAGMMLRRSRQLLGRKSRRRQHPRQLGNVVRLRARFQPGACGRARCSRRCGSARRDGRALRRACADGAARAGRPPARHLQHRRDCAERSRLRDRGLPAYWSTSAEIASVLRALARFLIHRARGNLHPTCVNGLAGAHHTPDAGSEESAQARSVSRPRRVLPRAADSCPIASCGPAFARSAVLLSSQFLRRDLACRAVLIRIAHLCPKRARLVLLAFRGIEIGKIELGHAG